MGFLDVINECDNFPHYDWNHPETWNSALLPLWRFCLPESDQAFGFLIPATVNRMPWTPEFHLNKSSQTIQMVPENGGDMKRSSAAAIARLLKAAQEAESFPKLSNWPGEKCPVLGSPFPFAVGRAIAPYLGIVSTGLQLVVFVRGNGRDVTGIWVARRGASKSTYPEMLDTSVGGALKHDETPFEGLMREAREEIGINARAAKPGGAISWFNIKSAVSGITAGLVEPGVQLVYDLEVGPGEVLKPAEEGIDWLRLLGVDEVKAALLRHEFKPSCACVMVDFLVRHGLINTENEKQFPEIVTRLHRKLPLPTASP